MGLFGEDLSLNLDNLTGGHHWSTKLDEENFFRICSATETDSPWNRKKEEDVMGEA